MADDDFSSLARDLGEAGVAAIPFATKAVAVSANKIKQAWRGKVAGAEALGGLAAALSYDVTVHVGDVQAEIGYDKNKFQGPLGNISEFGTPRTSPRGYGAAALQENAADFEYGVSRAVDDALKAHDL